MKKTSITSEVVLGDKIIISKNDSSLKDYSRLSGVITTYAETGISPFFVFYDDDITKEPWGRTYALTEGMILEIDDVLFLLKKDRVAAFTHGFPFFPQGFSADELRQLIKEKKKIALWFKP